MKLNLEEKRKERKKDCYCNNGNIVIALDPTCSIIESECLFVKRGKKSRLYRILFEELKIVNKGRKNGIWQGFGATREVWSCQLRKDLLLDPK